MTHALAHVTPPPRLCTPLWNACRYLLATGGRAWGQGYDPNKGIWYRRLYQSMNRYMLSHMHIVRTVSSNNCMVSAPLFNCKSCVPVALVEDFLGGRGSDVAPCRALLCTTSCTITRSSCNRISLLIVTVCDRSVVTGPCAHVQVHCSDSSLFIKV